MQMFLSSSGHNEPIGRIEPFGDIESFDDIESIGHIEPYGHIEPVEMSTLKTENYVFFTTRMRPVEKAG